MAWHPPIDPEFVQALRVLDAIGMPHAEAWRMLKPIARRLGVPRPSYPSIRRVLIAERERKRRRAEKWDQITTDLLRGVVPREPRSPGL